MPGGGLGWRGTAVLALAVLAGVLGLPARAVPGALEPLGRNAAGYREFRGRRDGSILIEVPAGRFRMGSSRQPEASPPHEVTLRAFLIGRDEVTNAQFARFVRAAKYETSSRWEDYFEPGTEAWPVVHVSWEDARAYCRWAGLRLPTEAEWERAARGTEGRMYPWGNRWDPERCNNLDLKAPAMLAKMIRMDRRRGTLPVGSLPAGASPCGARDMLGNALEWCSTGFRPYPWRGDDGREDPRGAGDKVVRGGCWASAPQAMATWRRDHTPKDYWYFYQYPGFRVAASR